LGEWNDFECASEKSYLVEFDTTPGDFETAVVTFDNIEGDDVDAVPAVVEEEEELAATGYDAAIILALALALLALGSVLTVRARKN
jgi:LPXTG-motif cell wall-anchored protein